MAFEHSQPVAELGDLQPTAGQTVLSLGALWYGVLFFGLLMFLAARAVRQATDAVQEESTIVAEL